MEFDDEWRIDEINDDLNIDENRHIQRDRVFLKNIPAGLDSHGLRNACEPYGKIIEIIRPAEQSYAFVQFQSAAYVY